MLPILSIVGTLKFVDDATADATDHTHLVTNDYLDAILGDSKEIRQGYLI